MHIAEPHLHPIAPNTTPSEKLEPLPHANALYGRHLAHRKSVPHGSKPARRATEGPLSAESSASSIAKIVRPNVAISVFAEIFQGKLGWLFLFRAPNA